MSAGVWEQLSPRWAELCRSAGTAVFLWSHNGVKRNGWVELQRDGRLLTSWCEGSWKVSGSDADVVEMCFGSSRHLCRIREGGFEVERKFLVKTGKESYKP